jgi:murein DD-endopeptidase MepM/ murein hydrolase activator NlpD
VTEERRRAASSVPPRPGRRVRVGRMAALAWALTSALGTGMIVAGGGPSDEATHLTLHRAAVAAAHGPAGQDVGGGYRTGTPGSPAPESSLDVVLAAAPTAHPPAAGIPAAPTTVGGTAITATTGSTASPLTTGPAPPPDVADVPPSGASVPPAGAGSTAPPPVAGIPAPPPGAGVAAPGAGYAWPMLPAPAVVTPFRAPSHPYGPGHRGVDLGGAPGGAVLAARAGTVVFAGPVGGRDLVSVLHDDGLRTTYEPVQPVVEAGAVIRAGEVIGLLQPGHACVAQTCLHWGVRRDRNEYLDPLVLLRPPRVRLLPVPIPWPDG